MRECASLELVLDEIPEGWNKKKIESVYQQNEYLVLLGQPDEHHNCELMKCSPRGYQKDGTNLHTIAYAVIVKGT